MDPAKNSSDQIVFPFLPNYHTLCMRNVKNRSGTDTGRVVAACIGSPDRLSYLLVGDTINLASRLQSLTRKLDAGIIISADTIARLPRHLVQKNLFRHSQTVQVKGRQMDVDIFVIA